MTLFEEVQALLLHEWDPIGIVALEGPEDEYDQYAYELIALAPPRPGEIAQYLAETRSVRMCLGSCSINEKELKVAEKLAALLKDARNRNSRP